MISKKIGTLEHWNKTRQKVLIFQGFLMFQFFLIIGTMFQKIGTYWNNWNKRPRLLLLFSLCNPAGEHPVRSDIDSPPGTGRVLFADKSNTTL